MVAELVPQLKMTTARTEEIKGGHEKKKDAAVRGLWVSWS